MSVCVCVCVTHRCEPPPPTPQGTNRHLFLPFIDLMDEKLQLYQIDGSRDSDENTAAHDYRQSMGSVEAGVYVYPLGPLADGILEETFSRVTGGVGLADAQSTQVRVTMTRTLQPPPLAVDRVAFLDFNESFVGLGKSGTSDYLALARDFDTVFLRGVPELKPHQVQAARFVNLVDVLYERRRRLAISAAFPPAELLRVVMADDDGQVPEPVGGFFGDNSQVDFSNTARNVAQSFRRASSRLEEMRSQKYWRKGGC